MASIDPLVVVFDDIHWAEPAFLDLIEYVAAFAQDVPLFILCTARPDLFELRPTWTAPKPNANLHARSALGDESAALAVSSAILRESRDGSPRQPRATRFVEQLVAMQAESGNGELEVPATLQALLASRIDRLAEHERAVAQRGSVEGRLFHRGAVTALLPEPSDRRSARTCSRSSARS